MRPRPRAHETSGYVGNKIGTPLKTAVTDDNTRAYAQSCAYASPLATVCRPSSAPPGSDNFIALPPVPALTRLHWGLIICRPRSWTQIFGSPMASGAKEDSIAPRVGRLNQALQAWLNCAGAQLNQRLPALVKSPRNARWCMRYHAKHAITEPTHVGARR